MGGQRMAAIPGIFGLVNSWGSGSDFSHKLVTSNNKPASITCRISGEAHPSVTFTSSTPGAVYPRRTKGLHAWSGTINQQLATPQVGARGLLTYSSGYALNVRSYQIQISASALESTIFNSGGVKWFGFTPGVI